MESRSGFVPARSLLSVSWSGSGQEKRFGPAILPICLQATLVGMLLSACFLDFSGPRFLFTLILCTVVSKMDLSDELPKVEHADQAEVLDDASVRAVIPADELA